MFLYGINDLFDKDTDKLNAKKISKEIRVTKRNDILYRVVILGAILFAIPLFPIFNEKSQLLAVIFFLLSFF